MNAPILPLTLPLGFCPATLQDLWNGFAAAGFVQLPDALTQTVWQPTKPTDTTVAWGQLDALGRPVRIYRFAQGAWLSLHPMAPGQIIILEDVLPNLDTYDGSDANALSAISGHMWEVSTVIDAKFPFGVGNPPIALPSGLIVSQGSTGGEEKHTLLATENGPHTHDVSLVTPVPDKWAGSASGAGKITTGSDALNAGDEAAITANNPFFKTELSGGDATTHVAIGHQNMPPYVGVYFLKRTNRLYYAVP